VNRPADRVKNDTRRCRARRAVIVITCCFLAAPVAAQETLSHGRFEDVRLFRPGVETRDTVVLFSGREGWNDEMGALARALAGAGALVAGVDLGGLERNLDADAAACVSPEGDVENLAHFVEAYAQLPVYGAPVLAGYADGGAFAYALLAQAERGIFMGAISLAYCPRLVLQKPLCPSARPDASPVQPGAQPAPAGSLGGPWRIVQGADDSVCTPAMIRDFAHAATDASVVVAPALGHDAPPSRWSAPLLAAYAEFASARPSNVEETPPDLRDLPITEVLARSPADTFAVFISGDGGWAGLDKNTAAALASRGISVVGIDSLRYFWKPRTPQSVADDVDRVVRAYRTRWHARAAILVGYSQGANVMPFAVNRLPAATRGNVSLVALLGLGRFASFEFHLSSWLTREQSGAPILPELTRLRGMRLLCLYGEGESESLCPQLTATDDAQVVQLPGGHHFDSNYERLADLIIQSQRRASPASAGSARSLPSE
jgi:type IV secretory pathway VirJ component